MSAILEVDALVAGYEPDMPIVNGARLTVGHGEITVILGPNGAGKSTLIKAIAGLVPVFSGTVRFEGRDITSTPAHQLVREGLAFVPQTDNVFVAMSIDDNLRLAAGILPKRERARRIAEMYEFFPDLAGRRGLAAGRLSGGQRQMVAIARALVVSPRLIILDEPSAGLSPKMVEHVFERLTDVRASGVTVVLVEQNAKAALSVADRALVLVEGRNRHEGPAATLAADAEIAELYLGGLAAHAPETRPARRLAEVGR
ncbi:MAG: ABC transporter ATP-binding protein [Ancalomicrobiaceae bacterium]|nr:ABC transporter ATP-binding protein [Ancalomicrobiaceae bacterium]